MLQFRVGAKEHAKQSHEVTTLLTGGVASAFASDEDDEEQPKEDVFRPPPVSWFKSDDQGAGSIDTTDRNLCTYDDADDGSLENGDTSVVKKRQADGDDASDVKRVKSEDAKKTAGLVSLGRFKQERSKGDAPTSRYISRLLQKSTHREMEQEIIKTRQLKKEASPAEEDVFVTRAYRKRLEERKKFEEEMLKKDLQDAVNDPRKKKDLSSFHHFMLSTGLASRSSRPPNSSDQPKSPDRPNAEGQQHPSVDQHPKTTVD